MATDALELDEEDEVDEEFDEEAALPGPSSGLRHRNIGHYDERPNGAARPSIPPLQKDTFLENLGERTPLIGNDQLVGKTSRLPPTRSKSRRRRRSSIGSTGDATVTQAVLMVRNHV